MYTVKQLANLAGVSVRTLHYYDEIDLLKPSSVGDNGYRYYADDSLLRLQQILFYREMDLGLLQIKDIIDTPDFDLVTALRSHRTELQSRMARLNSLIGTIDTTIMHLAGEVQASGEQLFAGFSEKKQKQYAREAAERYGPETVNESMERWSSYSARQKAQIIAEGEAIYRDLAANMAGGPRSPGVQAIVKRWHQHLRYFYEPTPEILRGLGHLYNQQPDFIATFQRLHPDLPAFLEQAIGQYCDALGAGACDSMLSSEAS